MTSLKQHKYHGTAGLISDAECWIQVLKWWYKDKNKNVDGRGLPPRVTTQYTRIDWCPRVMKELAYKTPQKLQVATFGWWEIKILTKEAYDKLLKHLVNQGIHVCTITGMPALNIAAHIQSHESYKWYGPLTSGYETVGLLVKKEIEHLVSQRHGTQTTSQRMLVHASGNLVIQSVYSPYVGQVPMNQYKLFLEAVLDNHQKTKDTNPTMVVWTMGDINLSGIAPGHERLPRPNSARQRTSQWMRDQLKLRGLGVVRTLGTHRRGAALDVHITEDADRYQAKVLDLGKRYSDHCVSMVQTGVMIPQTYRTTTEMKGCSTNVLWNCDPKRWAKALQKVTGIVKHQGHTFKETVLKMQAKRPHTGQ